MSVQLSQVTTLAKFLAWLPFSYSVIALALSYVPTIRKFRATEGARPVTLLLIGLIGFLLAPLFWYVIPGNGLIPGNATQQSSKPSVRLKYSSRQTIQCKVGDPNQIINLDNIATMTLLSCGEETVEFLVAKTGATYIKQPQPGKNYNVGGGLSVKSGPGVVSSNAMILSGPAKPVHFSVDNRIEMIDVGDRKFRVSLDQINDESGNNEQRFSYVFAISEE